MLYVPLQLSSCTLLLLPSWQKAARFVPQGISTTSKDLPETTQWLICQPLTRVLYAPPFSASPQVIKNYYLFKSQKMTERYVQLTQDLQYAKREVATWRQRHTQAETEMQGLKEEIKQLKRAVEGLQETNHKLTLANKQLNEDKESIASGYSTEISVIKQQIAAKHKEIVQLRDVASPVKLDQQIAIRQLKYDLNEEYSQRTMAKDKKLQEVSALLQRANYQKEIEREKAKLKIQALQDSLRELQQRHDAQIQEYSTRLYQQAQHLRPLENNDYLRRIKRQNEELRRKMELNHSELTAVLQEKNQVTKDYNKWMNEYKKTISEHQTEMQIYKVEVQRLNDLLEQRSNKKDEMTLRDRQREIKRLKSELEEIRDEVIFKDKKIADLQLQRVRLLNEIKVGRAEREKAGSIIEEELRVERQRLIRELNETKTSLDRVRSQNLQLQDKVHDITRLNTQNVRRWETTKGEEEARNRLKRQRSEQVIPTVDKSVDNINISKEKEDKRKGNDEVVNAVNIEKQKVKEILVKYIEAKKRNTQLEKKLQKANDKIVELLQHKIILGSPKAATTKKFEFPTQGGAVNPNQHSFQIDQTKVKRFTSNDSRDHSPSPGKFHTHTMAEIRHRPVESMAYTNPNLRREFFSPQDDRLIRIEDEDANECSYYEKSLKIKHGQRFRELKCTNHQE